MRVPSKRSTRATTSASQSSACATNGPPCSSSLSRGVDHFPQNAAHALDPHDQYVDPWEVPFQARVSMLSPVDCQGRSTNGYLSARLPLCRWMRVTSRARVAPGQWCSCLQGMNSCRWPLVGQRVSRQLQTDFDEVHLLDRPRSGTDRTASPCLEPSLQVHERQTADHD